METLRLDPSKTYLLRFIGATSLDMVDVAIDGHDMTVVEAVRTPALHHLHSCLLGL